MVYLTGEKLEKIRSNDPDIVSAFVRLWDQDEVRALAAALRNNTHFRKLFIFFPKEDRIPECQNNDFMVPLLKVIREKLQEIRLFGYADSPVGRFFLQSCSLGDRCTQLGVFPDTHQRVVTPDFQDFLLRNCPSIQKLVLSGRDASVGTILRILASNEQHHMRKIRLQNAGWTVGETVVNALTDIFLSTQCQGRRRKMTLELHDATNHDRELPPACIQQLLQTLSSDHCRVRTLVLEVAGGNKRGPALIQAIVNNLSTINVHTLKIVGYPQLNVEIIRGLSANPFIKQFHLVHCDTMGPTDDETKVVVAEMARSLRFNHVLNTLYLPKDYYRLPPLVLEPLLMALAANNRNHDEEDQHCVLHTLGIPVNRKTILSLSTYLPYMRGLKKLIVTFFNDYTTTPLTSSIGHEMLWEPLCRALDLNPFLECVLTQSAEDQEVDESLQEARMEQICCRNRSLVPLIRDDDPDTTPPSLWPHVLSRIPPSVAYHVLRPRIDILTRPNNNKD